MNKVAYMLAGVVVGAVVSLCCIQPRLQLGRTTVLECRQQVSAFDDWPTDLQARFNENLRECAKSRERWRIVKAIAAIPLDEKTH